MLRRLVQADEHPTHFFARLKGIETYKLRVGDYRLLCDIDHALEVIHVRVIGHRKNIYD